MKLSLLLWLNFLLMYTSCSGQNIGSGLSPSPFLESGSGDMPSTNITNPDPTCSRSVDQVRLQLSSAVSEDVLSIWCANVTTQANIYCTNQSWTICGLPTGYAGNFNISHCIACLISNSRKRQTTGSIIQYYMRLPDGSGNTVPINALLTITNLAKAAFEAATGVQVLQVYGVYINWFQGLVKLLIIIAGVVGGIILVVLILMVVCIIACIVGCVCVAKKSKNRVIPSPSERTPLGGKGGVSRDSGESLEYVDNIHLTK